MRVKKNVHTFFFQIVITNNENTFEYSICRIGHVFKTTFGKEKKSYVPPYTYHRDVMSFPLHLYIGNEAFIDPKGNLLTYYHSPRYHWKTKTATSQWLVLLHVEW